MLRVVVDARSISGKKSGVGNGLEALLRHMLPLAEGFRFLLLRHPDAEQPLLRDERVEELTFPGETKSAATVFGLGFAHRFGDWDLFHSPGDIVPLGLGCPWVVTTHDLMWVEAPELASAFAPVRLGYGLWYRATFGRAIRGARRVIAISETTARAIARIYPSEAEKVRVVRHGFDASRHDARLAGPRSLLEPWLPRGVRYSLIVGQGSPYKNHVRMVRAFVEAMGSRSDHRLVLVRRFARVDPEMDRLLARPDVRALVVPLPHVTDEILFALYAHAHMLLFASLYEGFGLPALEAMGFGLPVLASTTDALLEVTGDAALHADPWDHADLVAKIRALDADVELRGRLCEAGKRRAQSFSWELAARKTLEVYREAVEAR
ncbi:MAG: glycosyltransferase family 4 protein [Polyangiaceae bacterium]|nr:glycosyltransferase family 4 protein [Polyangiaceae bacterium]